MDAIHIFNLLLTPLLIAAVSLAGRRWGAAVSGWLIGIPLTSGPVSFILASQYGLDFAVKAAVGTIGGQASVCVFCLTYYLAARKLNWLGSSVAAIVVFILSIATWKRFSPALFLSYALILLIIAAVLQIIPRYAAVSGNLHPPVWDLPARMLVATAFVLVLTTFANLLGAQLSGLISPFPVFGVILAAFTHKQQGAQATANFLRGNVIGSLGFATFFMVVGGLLPALGLIWTYLLAAGVAVVLNGTSILWVNRRGIY